MELKKGFQQTDIGAIPEEWDVITLGDIAVIRDGTHQTPKYVTSGIPFYSVEHVTSGDFSNTKYISEEEHRFLTRYFKIEKGDILMTRIGSIGDCVYIDWDVDASFYVSLALLKVHSAYARYIVAYSEYSAFKNEVDLHSLPSATPKKINLGPISDIRIPLPSDFEEQKAIATVMSDVDVLLDGLERLISKKRSLKKATMQKLLSGKTRLPGFEDKWEEKSIINVSKNIMDFRGRTPKKLGMAWGGGDIPALSAGNVKMGYIDFSEECYMGSPELYSKWMVHGDVKKDDIVFTTEAPLGNVALIPDDRKYIMSQRTILLQVKPKIVFNKFLYQMLCSEQFQNYLKNYSSGSTAKGIQRKQFEKLAVLIPPLDEQEAIAGILIDMDEQIEALEHRYVKTRNLKAAIMQELLTGKIRLVEQGKDDA